MVPAWFCLRLQDQRAAERRSREVTGGHGRSREVSFRLTALTLTSGVKGGARWRDDGGGLVCFNHGVTG